MEGMYTPSDKKITIEKHVIGVLFVEYRLSLLLRGCRGHDRLIVGFTTTCAISVYHH
jgi:hypothetical protein